MAEIVEQATRRYVADQVGLALEYNHISTERPHRMIVIWDALGNAVAYSATVDNSKVDVPSLYSIKASFSMPIQVK